VQESLNDRVEVETTYSKNLMEMMGRQLAKCKNDLSKVQLH